MSVAIITGSAGLVGSEATKHFASKGMDVFGLDNDMRSSFFGEEASTSWMNVHLERTVPSYVHHSIDIRNHDAVFNLFRRYGRDISIVIHAAAQPSHDWAAREPITDFSINAMGTLNMLEATRLHCPDAAFVFTSTNKVYGDNPNRLPLVELDTRWEISPTHAFSSGIDESMSLDHCMHSVFGASKAAADLMVQEYGRYFGMRTACFRCGCITGPSHSATQLHGFLAYLMRCCVTRTPYRVFGYLGKQVRDNIHSYDLVQAFDEFVQSPRAGEVYNMGGGRFSNCSMLEAIDLCERISSTPLRWTYAEQNRAGDHLWWIGDLSKFKSHYPRWQQTYNVRNILQESYELNAEWWLQSVEEVAV